jgi:hypothetical protein
MGIIVGVPEKMLVTRDNTLLLLLVVVVVLYLPLLLLLLLPNCALFMPLLSEWRQKCLVSAARSKNILKPVVFT